MIYKPVVSLFAFCVMV